MNQNWIKKKKSEKHAKWRMMRDEGRKENLKWKAEGINNDEKGSNDWM
jgi:hypothetical protein